MPADKKSTAQPTDLYIVNATHTSDKQDLSWFDHHTLGLYTGLGQNSHQFFWIQEIDDL